MLLRSNSHLKKMFAHINMLLFLHPCLPAGCYDLQRHDSPESGDASGRGARSQSVAEGWCTHSPGLKEVAQPHQEHFRTYCGLIVTLQESYERAKALLKSHTKEHKNLADALLMYETLDAKEIQLVLEGKVLETR